MFYRLRMSKMKTIKAISKRFKIKKSKVIKRKAGQDHFNAKESSKKTRNKRRDVLVSDDFSKNIKKLISNSK